MEYKYIKSSQYLSDKVIVITGGTKGVGRAFAEIAGLEGAKVVISGRDEKTGNEIVNDIHKFGSEAIFVTADLLKISNIRNLFKTCFEKFGRLDGLFYYAGVTPISPLDTCDEKTFDMVMDVNFKACFFACQEAIHYMRMNNGGSIVLTGSSHAWSGQKDRAAYACSKGAEGILMEHIAHNYASEFIRCNYLTLGWTATEGEIALRESLGESEDQLRKRASEILPMGRMLERNDYMDPLLYLFSDASAMMTGSVLRVTGGEYI